MEIICGRYLLEEVKMIQHFVREGVVVLLLLMPFCLANAQWTRVSIPQHHLDAFWADTNEVLLGSRTKVYRSTDNGDTWVDSSDLGTIGISAFARIGSNLIASTSILVIWPNPSNRIFRSPDGGHTWQPIVSAVCGASSLQTVNEKLYANIDADLMVSSDAGTSWTKLNTGPILTGQVNDIAATPQVLYVQAGLNRLIRSMDEGVTWDSIAYVFPGSIWAIVAQNATVLLSVFQHGFYRSDDFGTHWRTVDSGLPDSTGCAAMDICENTLVAAVERNFTQSIRRLKLSDSVWGDFGSGINLGYTAWVQAISHNPDFVFVACDSGVFRSPVSEVVSIHPSPKPNSPVDFLLEQCFPNPFNPSTTIRFSLQTRSRVRLAVFDLLGQRVAELANEELNAGNFARVWNANVPSGLYFYRLEAVSLNDPNKRFVDVKKMVLMK